MANQERNIQRRRPENQPARRVPPERQRRSGSASSQPARVENRWFRAIWMVVVTIGLCVLMAVIALQSATDLFGINKPDMQIEVDIPPNADLGDIATLLGRRGVIQQPLTFRVYAGIKKKDATYHTGMYVFDSNMGYDEIIVALKTGNTFKEEVRITFIEGETLVEIAQKLEENRVCDANEFIEQLQTGEFTYEFIEGIPSDSLRFRRLEGYIFPDTYDFYVGENVASVARKFLRNFNEKITPELETQMRELNMTLDQTIILASLIQKEAGQKEDMSMVSSVFHNRMGNTGTYPKLQSDVTIFYVEKNIKPYLQHTNQPMYDAYNTYVCDGLPVGAICNPGMNAIEAALYPTKSTFNFFVTDAKGQFYYAANLQQHNRNVATAMRVEGGSVHGIDTQ